MPTYKLISFLLIGFITISTQAQAQAQVVGICSPSFAHKAAADALDQILESNGPQKIQAAISALISIRNNCDDDQSGFDVNQGILCQANASANLNLYDSNGPEGITQKVGLGTKMGLLETNAYSLPQFVSTYYHVRVLSGPLTGQEGFSAKGTVPFPCLLK